MRYLKIHMFHGWFMYYNSLIFKQIFHYIMEGLHLDSVLKCARKLTSLLKQFQTGPDTPHPNRVVILVLKYLKAHSLHFGLVSFHSNTENMVST